jgi:hypothetical protein
VYKATGLSYSEYVSSGIGGSVWFTKASSGVNDGDVNRKFSPINTTNSVFVSFLAQIDSAQTTADYFFHLGQNTIGTTNYRGRVFVRRNGNGWSLGLSKSNETQVDDNTILNFGQTYLVMLKYSFSTATSSDDQVMLYVYSSGIPLSEPGNPIVTIGPTGLGTGSDPSNIGSVAIRQGSSTPTGYVDGIRVDSSWSNAIPTSVKSQSSTLLTKFVLQQNYPNPFNSSTMFKFFVPTANHAVLKVFNLLGQEVATLFDGIAQAGTLYTAHFNAANFPSGVYIARLENGGNRIIKKMVLTK